MQRLGLIANLTRQGAHKGLARLMDAANACGLTLFADAATAAYDKRLNCCAPHNFSAQGIEGVISLGGDGTLLLAAHTLADAHIDLPLIGLNVGNLGYLTAANEEDFETILGAVSNDDFTITSRTALTGEHRRNSEKLTVLHSALNDIVLSRCEGGHALTIEVTLDAHPVAHYCCDGLIVATPTGSTAYSLSVGGPIVVSGTPALVLSVIAPHALTARPLVVPDKTQICMRLVSDSSAAIYCDGQRAVELLPEDEVHITAAPQCVRIIVPNTHSPYTALSQKLGWGAAFTR